MRPVVREIVELRRKGFRFILLADDNFYPVTLADLAAAARRTDKRPARATLKALRAERFELMATARAAAGGHGVLHADHDGSGRGSGVPRRDARARIRGALVGVESVTPEGLKAVYKDFNQRGRGAGRRGCRRSSEHGVHVLGSFIFGLPTDTPETFDATADLAQRAGGHFAQFVMLHAVPGHGRFREVGERPIGRSADVDGDAAHPLLADPAVAAAEGLLAAPDDVGRGDPARNAGGLGSLLRLPLIWQRIDSASSR